MHQLTRWALGASALCVAVVCTVPNVFEEGGKAQSGYVPRAISNSFEGRNFHRDLLRSEGEVDWKGLQQLRTQLTQDLRSISASLSSEGTVESPPIWHEMGPSETAGRTRALAVLGGDSLLAGGVSGGLWMSDNRGGRWSLVETFPYYTIGSIAVAGNGDIYVGTGSYFDFNYGNGDSGGRGRGIYWSNDNGATWSPVALSTGGTTIETSQGSPDYSWNATDGLAADPIVDNRVWCASIKGFGSIANGVFTGLPDGANVNAATDVSIAPDGAYCLVVSTSGRVYRSSGGDFTSLVSVASGAGTGGALPQSGIGRTRVDIADVPNEDGTFNAFALFATSSGLFRGLYFSGAAGQFGTWEEVWPGGVPSLTPLPQSQGFYDLALGVSPYNPRLAYVGGVELWRAGPEQQAELAAYPYNLPGYGCGIHPDVHEIVTSEDGSMYVCTDGGVYRSDDGGLTYQPKNKGFNVTQFYALAFGPNGEVLGGTQDNGTLLLRENANVGVQLHGGDGFDCGLSQRIDAADSSIAFVASAQNGNIIRGRVLPDEVVSSGGFLDANLVELQNSDGALGQFYTCLRLFEHEEHENEDMLVLGLNGDLGIWMTRDVTNFETQPAWVRLADAPSGTGVKAIEFVEHGEESGDVVFVTGWNGSVTRIRGLRNVVTQADVEQLEVTSMIAGAGAAVTGLSVDPNNANHVVVTVGGFTTSSSQGGRKVRETYNAIDSDFNPSVDWNNIWSEDYPNMPCYDVVVDVLDNSGQTMFVATEFGVFTTVDGGLNWAAANDGMTDSNVGVFAPVFDLKQQTRQGPGIVNYGALYAASHGRGMYTTQTLLGCTEEAACNYWRGASVDNGTCEFESCKGCTDPMSCNYDPSATTSAACSYDCIGCTDIEALNFDNDATIDDGSCIPSFENCSQLLSGDWPTMNLGWFPGDTVLWEAGTQQTVFTAFVVPDSIEDGGLLYATDGFLYGSVAGLPGGLSLGAGDVASGQTGCWVFEGTIDSLGTFPISVSGDLVVEAFASSIPVTFSFTTVIQTTTPQGVVGCTYPLAVNFEPLATADDGTCIFSGCTDSTAANYSLVFGVDDGSCLNVANDLSCPEDLTQDGLVNTMDLLLFLGAYGSQCN